MSAAGYKVSANYVEASVLSRPALLTHDEAGNCLIICRHCGKVTQVQCKEAATSPCDEQGCTDTDNCDEICIHQRIYSQAQMDEKVAQAQEKEILTTLYAVRIAKERYEDDDNATIEDALDDIRYHLEGSLIDIQEKTLRIGGEPR